MSDGKLLPDVFVRGSGPDVCDEVGVTCIRIAILCFLYLSGGLSRSIDLGDLTASLFGEIL